MIIFEKSNSYGANYIGRLADAAVFNVYGGLISAKLSVFIYTIFLDQPDVSRQSGA
ncbi:hypothetical protein ACO0KY_10255 [Undibacterium sp. Dicai25W]|uniref:hypothetical protein n=1 Tax=Undibacterium sp. Dicai25W TaxID=3413034 RepID=UPI003BF3A15F